MGVARLSTTIAATLIFFTSFVSPSYAEIDSCNSPEKASIDFYFLLDLSDSIEIHGRLFSFSQVFIQQCQAGDTFTLIGFNEYTETLVNKAECGNIRGEFDKILRALSEKRQEFEPLNILTIEQQYAIVRLNRGRSKTDFEKLSQELKKHIASLYPRGLLPKNALVQLEHRNRLVVLMTDGVPDFRGFPRFDRMAPGHFIELGKQLAAHHQGWLHSNFASLKKIDLKELVDLEMEDTGQLETDLLILLGSELLCGYGNHPNSTNLEAVAQQLHRLWEIKPFCPEDQSIKSEIESHLKELRNKLRHLSIDEKSIVTYWPETNRDLRLKMKLKSNYQFSHDLSQNDLSIELKMPRGREPKPLFFSFQQKIRPRQDSEVEIPVKIPEDSLKQGPGEVVVKFENPKSIHKRLRFRGPTCSKSGWIPSHGGVRVQINNSWRTSTSLSSVVGVDIEVDNTLPSCLIVQPFLVEPSNDPDVQFISQTPLCIQGGAPEKGTVNQWKKEFLMSVSPPGAADITLGFDVTTARDCGCTERDGWIHTNVNSSGDDKVKLQLVSLNKWFFGGSVFLSLWAMYLIRRTFLGRLDLTPRQVWLVGKFSFPVDNLPFYLVGMALALHYSAFGGLNEWYSAFVDWSGIFLHVAFVTLVAALFCPHRILKIKNNKMGLVQEMRIFRLAWEVVTKIIFSGRS